MSNYYNPGPASPYGAGPAAYAGPAPGAYSWPGSAVLQSAAMGATVGAAAATAAQLRQPQRQTETMLREVLAAAAITGVTAGTLAWVRQNAPNPSGLGTAATLFLTGTALMLALAPRQPHTKEERE